MIQKIVLLLLGGLSLTHLTAQTENTKSMNDWQYPYEVHHQRVSDSVELAYVDVGSGPHTLLFVHGLGSYLKAWHPTIENLRPDFRCIAIDLPGYGKSSKEDYSFEMTFFAETLAAFIQQLELEQVTLIGHSMGGQISMHLALQDASLIESLVLLAPAGFERFTEAERNWFKNIFTPAVVKATPVPQIIKNFEANFYDMPEAAQSMIDDRLFMRETVEYDYYCDMIPKCVQGMLQQPVFDRLAEITIPTLVIFGSNDQLIPNQLLHPALTTVQVAQEGQAELPNSQLELLLEAGHFAHWDRPEAFLQRIQVFLKEKK